MTPLTVFVLNPPPTQPPCSKSLLLATLIHYPSMKTTFSLYNEAELLDALKPE